VDERDSPAGNVKQALNALEYASLRSETAQATPVHAQPTDFRAALTAELSRVRDLLDRVVMGADSEAGLDALLQTGALHALLPEVAALVGFGDGEWRHKDVWKHTKQVVDQAEQRLGLRWAALLHDIGKVRTRSITAEGEVHFFGHAELGARMFDRLARKLGLFRNDPKLQASIRFLILHHLRANQYEPSWTDSAVRRFARELGPELDSLLCLARADITTKRAERKRKGLRQIEELAQRIRDLAALDAVVPPLPGGLGDVIMQAFGLPPSRHIGDIKRALEAAIEAEEIPAHQPSEFYVDFLRKNHERFGIKP
jgi:poly(A) polymerase